MQRLQTSLKVVGLNQTKQAVRSGRAETVFVAEDAEVRVVQPLLDLCREHGTEVVSVPSMKALAKECKVDVPTACAAIFGKDA